MPNVDPIYNKLGDERLAQDEAGSYVEMWDGTGWMRSGRVHRLAAERIAELEAERDQYSAAMMAEEKRAKNAEDERDEALVENEKLRCLLNDWHGAYLELSASKLVQETEDVLEPREGEEREDTDG